MGKVINWIAAEGSRRQHWAWQANREHKGHKEVRNEWAIDNTLEKVGSKVSAGSLLAR